MKCEQADLLIMKYMDRELREEEALKLNSHLKTCEKCKESFMVFDSMLINMEEIPQVTTPDGFEEAVMAKIMALPVEQKKYVYSKKDKLKMVVVGSFAFFMSIAAILIVYRDSILNALLKTPRVGPYVEKLMPIVELIEKHSMVVLGFFEEILSGVDGILSAGAGLIATAIVSLCAVQYVLVRRKNR